ncbi:MAG: argininosuccinate lyase [Candidatus Micrarchaeia archaeon]
MKLWNTGSDVEKEVEKYLSSDNWADQKLVKYDCIGSIAHAKMLKKVGILNQKELEKLIKELNNIIKLDKKGEFIIKPEDEDVHTKIENHLTEKLGDIGEKIHTYRSRNDQILVDMRLFQKDKLGEIKQELKGLIRVIAVFEKKYKKIPMPGYTHMQKAMLSSVGLWAEAFEESLKDDLIILENAIELNNQNPLGSGASYGVSEKLDRDYTTKLLGFKKTQNNVLYCQNSKGKIESNILNSLSQIMISLSKMSQDIIIFSTSEFGYFKLSEKVSTGSSIMPQKKNPDLAELIKGNSNVVLSYEFLIKNTINGLNSGYLKETQVIKEPIIKGLELVFDTIKVMKILIEEIEINEKKCIESCTKELFAADEAYRLAKKGIPFRKAYLMVAKNLEKLENKNPKKELEKRLKKGIF